MKTSMMVCILNFSDFTVLHNTAQLSNEEMEHENPPFVSVDQSIETNESIPILPLRQRDSINNITRTMLLMICAYISHCFAYWSSL
jgi:hypothetical protein